MNTQKYQVTDKLILMLIWILSIVLIAFSKEPSYLHPGELEYPHLHLGEIVHSVNRGILAAFVLYFLLPRYFQTGRYFLFAGFLALSFFVLGLFEEGILRPLIFAEMDEVKYCTSDGLYKFVLEPLPLLGFMFFVKLTWEYRETQQKLITTEKEKIESELKFLRSQINPHILFNALNNIYSHSLTRSGMAPDMLLKLSNFLRYTLYECGSDLVLLERELQSLEDYVTLQKMGLEGRGQVSMSISGACKDRLVPPFVLITLVENCFKHSLDTQEKNIRIEVDIVINDDQLTLKTCNTYDRERRLANEGIKEQGVGIANVRRRLELLCSGSFSLRDRTNKGVFELELKMPLERPHTPYNGT